LCILSFFERDIRAIYREKFIITSYYSEENGNGLIGYMKDEKKAYLKTRVSNLFSGDYFYTVEVNPN
jgi:hypothetical protein